MSQLLLDKGKVYLSLLTCPASFEDRRLLQLTISDHSDYAQLTRDEVRTLVVLMDQWLHYADIESVAGNEWAVPAAPWMMEALIKNETLLDIPLRVWIGRRHLGKQSISTIAADFLRMLGLPPSLLHDVPKKDYRLTLTPFDVEY